MNQLKQNILNRVSDYQIFNHFLRGYHNEQFLKEGDHITNPIVYRHEGRTQETPSFNLYRGDGKWYFKDFAEDWCQGDIFEFIQQLYKTDFKGALQVINREMGLGLNENGGLKINDRFIAKTGKKEIEKKRIDEFSIIEKKFDSFELGYWRQYGDVSLSDLDFFHIRSLKWYASYSNKHEKWYDVYRKPGEPIFYYDHGSWGKIYMPLSKRKWDTLGKRKQGFLFGFEQLPPTGFTLDLTGGEKDVFSLYLHDFPAVTMNSEESKIEKYPILVDLLKKDRFVHKRILYDNDRTGRKKAKKIIREWNLRNNTEKLPIGYDISQYYKELIKKQR